MKLVLLPGHGTSNKSWMRDVALSLKHTADSISLHHYDHWHSQNDSSSLSNELAKIRTTLATNGSYVFVGKSMGVGLALASIKTHKRQPSACVFIGASLRSWDDHSHDLALALKGYAIPTLFIQNRDDPYGTYVELTKFIKKQNIKNASLYRATGEGHDYSDINEISSQITRFLEEQRLVSRAAES